MLHDVGAVEPALMIMSPEQLYNDCFAYQNTWGGECSTPHWESILHSAEIGR